MVPRTSSVDLLKVKIVSFSSVVHIGDSCIINSLSRALAVQRETQFFFGSEGNYADYSVFSEPIPFSPITEPFTSTSHHLNPIIKVKNINIKGTSAASVLNIGSSKNVSMEVRVKHIRQLLPRT